MEAPEPSRSVLASIRVSLSLSMPVALRQIAVTAVVSMVTQVEVEQMT